MSISNGNRRSCSRRADESASDAARLPKSRHPRNCNRSPSANPKERTRNGKSEIDREAEVWRQSRELFVGIHRKLGDRKRAPLDVSSEENCIALRDEENGKIESSTMPGGGATNEFVSSSRSLPKESLLVKARGARALAVATEGIIALQVNKSHLSREVTLLREENRRCRLRAMKYREWLARKNETSCNIEVNDEPCHSANETFVLRAQRPEADDIHAECSAKSKTPKTDLKTKLGETQTDLEMSRKSHGEGSGTELKKVQAALKKSEDTQTDGNKAEQTAETLTRLRNEAAERAAVLEEDLRTAREALNTERQRSSALEKETKNRLTAILERAKAREASNAETRSALLRAEEEIVELRRALGAAREEMARSRAKAAEFEESVRDRLSGAADKARAFQARFTDVRERLLLDAERRAFCASKDANNCAETLRETVVKLRETEDRLSFHEKKTKELEMLAAMLLASLGELAKRLEEAEAIAGQSRDLAENLKIERAKSESLRDRVNELTDDIAAAKKEARSATTALKGFLAKGAGDGVKVVGLENKLRQANEEYRRLENKLKGIGAVERNSREVQASPPTTRVGETSPEVTLTLAKSTQTLKTRVEDGYTSTTDVSGGGASSSRNFPAKLSRAAKLLSRGSITESPLPIGKTSVATLTEERRRNDVDREKTVRAIQTEEAFGRDKNSKKPSDTRRSCARVSQRSEINETCVGVAGSRCRVTANEDADGTKFSRFQSIAAEKPYDGQHYVETSRDTEMASRDCRLLTARSTVCTSKQRIPQTSTKRKESFDAEGWLRSLTLTELADLHDRICDATSGLIERDDVAIIPDGSERPDCRNNYGRAIGTTGRLSSGRIAALQLEIQRREREADTRMETLHRLIRREQHRLSNLKNKFYDRNGPDKWKGTTGNM